MTIIHELLGTVRTTRDWLLTQPRDPAAERLCAELTQRLVEAGWERAHQWELTADREGHLCPHCGAYISLSAMGDDQDEAELQPCTLIVLRPTREAVIEADILANGGDEDDVRTAIQNERYIEDTEAPP